VKKLRNHCRKSTSNGKFVLVLGGDIMASFLRKRWQISPNSGKTTCMMGLFTSHLSHFLRKLIFWEKSLQKGHFKWKICISFKRWSFGFFFSKQWGISQNGWKNTCTMGQFTSPMGHFLIMLIFWENSLCILHKLCSLELWFSLFFVLSTLLQAS